MANRGEQAHYRLMLTGRGRTSVRAAAPLAAPGEVGMRR